MEIAENCKGLPLTVVIVAGIIMTTEKEVWKEVLDSLRSGIISSADRCESTIELSYKHLPDHLKPCFLSFGAYPEDPVNVKRLTWEWIAKGFVRKSESKSLEEAAADYLNILIGRSLVLNAKESSQGCVKICRVHDLLHDFCLRKAKEEHFFHLLKSYEEHSYSDAVEISPFDEPELLPLDEPGNLRALYVYAKPEHFKKFKLFCPNLRSLVFLHPTEPDEKVDMSFIFRIFKRLRVLDLENVCVTRYFPRDIGILLLLRYLAIQVAGPVNPLLGNLSNLETLIIYSIGVVSFPDTFWNLRKLRHLYVVDYHRETGVHLPGNNLDSSCNLLELESLSTLCSHDWCIMEKQLRKFPNIRRLKCRLSLPDAVVDFTHLSSLESFSLSNGGDEIRRAVVTSFSQ